MGRYIAKVVYIHCKNRRVRLTQFGLPQLHQKVVLHHGTVVESL